MRRLSLAWLALAAALSACETTGGPASGGPGQSLPDRNLPARPPAAKPADAKLPAGVSAVPPRPAPAPAEEGGGGADRPQLAKLDDLVGLDEAGVQRLLGRPQGVRQQVPATVWTYLTDGCRLDLFFFHNLKAQRLQTLTYEVSSRKAAADAGACRKEFEGQGNVISS